MAPTAPNKSTYVNPNVDTRTPFQKIVGLPNVPYQQPSSDKPKPATIVPPSTSYVQATPNFTSQTGEAQAVTPSGQVVVSGGFSSVTGQQQVVSPTGQVISTKPVDILQARGYSQQESQYLVNANRGQLPNERGLQEYNRARQQLGTIAQKDIAQREQRVKSGEVKSSYSGFTGETITKQSIAQKEAAAQKNIEQPTEVKSDTQYYGIIEENKKPKDLIGKAEYFISESRAGLRTREARGKGDFTTTIGLIGVGAGLSLIQNIKYIKSVITEPVKTIKSIPSQITGAYEFTKSGQLANLLYNEPALVTGYLSSEFLLAKGTGAASEFTKEKISLVATRLSPSYRAVIKESGVETIKDISGKSRPIDIEIAKPLKDILIPIEEQTKVAGKTTLAVSAQRDLFGAIFNKERVIQKPIPGGELLSEQTKKLVTKMEAGQLNAKQLTQLNERIIKESGSKGLLERSFFADPYGRLRVSRLMKLDKFGNPEKLTKASFVDILSGDVTFKKVKPQAIVFEDAIVESLPKEVLKKGQIIPEKLLEFQLKPSGKFKPIGFLSREPEITLAPKEIIRSRGTIGRTIIKGKPVKIISAEIVGAQKIDANLLSKARLGLLSEKEIGKLSKSLKRETGLDYSYGLEDKKYLSPYRLSSESLSKLSKLLRKSESYTPKRLSSSSTSGISKSIYKQISKTSYEFKYKPTSYKSPQKYYPPKLSRDLSSKELITTTTTYNPPKKIKLNIKPFYPKKSDELNIIKSLGKGFDVFVIKNRRPTVVARGVSRGSALDIGAKEVLSDLKATFGLKESKLLGREAKTGGEFARFRNLFREPTRKSRYRKLGEVYIQRQSKVGIYGGRLSFKGEKRAIQRSKFNNIARSIA